MRTVLAIAGSLRRDSFNRRLLLAAATNARAGVRVHLWEGLAAVPAFDEDLEGEPAPAAVADLRQQIRVADSILIATPEYNGSIPGALKNALDWASRPYPDNVLRGKPALVIGASPSSRGGQRAQDDLRRVLAVIGAEVLDVQLTVASVHQRFDSHGTLTDDTLRRHLRQLLDRMIEDPKTPPARLAG